MRKGIFLGFIPNTTRNILWFDLETERVKIAKHAKFDEGMNDLPLSELPPNVTHLQRSEIGNRIPPDDKELSSDDFEFTISPFDEILTLDIRSSCNSPTFGLQIKTDEINNRVYIADVDKQSSADTSLNFQQLAKNKRRQLRGAYITAVNGTPVFDKASVIKEFRKL